MDACELRLWNIVRSMHNENEIGNIIGLSLDSAELETASSAFEVPNKLLQGVELTPFWLQELGLINNGKNQWSIPKSKVNLYLRLANRNSIILFDEYFCHMPIRYVHELQNFCFFKTGTELPLPDLACRNHANITKTYSEISLQWRVQKKSKAQAGNGFNLRL